MQYENVLKSDRCCSCYTCLPQTAPAAAQTDLKMDAAPGTGTGAPPVAQRLLTNTWPKIIHNINIQTNTNKSLETVHQYIKTERKTKLKQFYVLQQSRGHKERLKWS